jgi:hypothetical protein
MMTTRRRHLLVAIAKAKDTMQSLAEATCAHQSQKGCYQPHSQLYPPQLNFVDSWCLLLGNKRRVDIQLLREIGKRAIWVKAKSLQGYFFSDPADNGFLKKCSSIY